MGIKMNIHLKDGKAKSSAMTITALVYPAAAFNADLGHSPARVTAVSALVGNGVGSLLRILYVYLRHS